MIKEHHQFVLNTIDSPLFNSNMFSSLEEVKVEDPMEEEEEEDTN